MFLGEMLWQMGAGPMADGYRVAGSYCYGSDRTMCFVVFALVIRHYYRIFSTAITTRKLIILETVIIVVFGQENQRKSRTVPKCCEVQIFTKTNKQKLK